MRIGAGEVDDEIGCVARHDQREQCRKSREVGIVAGAVIEIDVEVTGDFSQRIVVSPVHRECEHALVAGKDRMRSIALMDVEVDHQGTVDSSSVELMPYRDGDVVENAESLAPVREGV